MDMRDFSADKILGFGTFTITNEVVYNRGEQRDIKYAMKSYFLSTSEAVHRALRERNTLTHLLSETHSFPFSQTFFWAIGSWKTPSIITTIGSKFDLQDLRKSKGRMNDDIARFYIAEIMCGLEYIHRMGIVH
nr:serine:threonine protein kinase [Hymenolepis microstoma]CUU98274.1 serine:threonine protein kinase [Hymenolepis microstoma]CUU98428.1 serine:threonine protein kinase [Hymenolepis microstoma]